MFVDKTVRIAKETDDVLALVEAVIVNRKSGQDVQMLLDELITAIDGVAEIDDEAKEDRKAVLSTVGLRLGSITDAILSPSTKKLPSEASN